MGVSGAWMNPAFGMRIRLIRETPGSEVWSCAGFIESRWRLAGEQADGRVSWDAIFIELEARGRLAGGEARLGEREPPDRDGLTIIGPGLRPGRARERGAWS